MEFTLYYKGKLKSNGNTKEKQRIRNYFSNQIKKLWDQEPLINFKQFLDDETDAFSRQIKGVKFSSIINNEFHYVADIDIVLLHNEPIYKMIKNGGDIDNRIKTLLDALKMPSRDEFPVMLRENNENDRIFCLLHDDSLVSSLKITAKQYLGSEINDNEVILLIDVHARKISTLLGGMELP